MQSLREEFVALIKRKRKADEDCKKLGKSLIGVKKYMDFFDTTIWSWPAHKYILTSRSVKLQGIASNCKSWPAIRLVPSTETKFYLQFGPDSRKATSPFWCDGCTQTKFTSIVSTLPWLYWKRHINTICMRCLTFVRKRWFK